MKMINNHFLTPALGADVKTGVANLSISKIVNNTMATDEPRSVKSNDLEKK